MFGLKEDYTEYVALPAMMTSTPTRQDFEIDLLSPCELFYIKSRSQSMTYLGTNSVIIPRVKCFCSICVGRTMHVRKF